MITLNPFIDEDGLLRIGGWLRHAELPEKNIQSTLDNKTSNHHWIALPREINNIAHAYPSVSFRTLTLHLIREDY